MSIQSIHDAQEQVAQAIAQDPGMAHSKNTPAVAALQHDLKFRVTGSAGEVVETDMPRGMGGSAAAPSPGWLLRAALASCTGTVIAMRAARRGVALTALEVTVESESDHRGILGLDDAVSAGLYRLRMHVKIGGKGAAAAELRSLAQWADQHSPVGCTLREARGARLEIEIV